MKDSIPKIKSIYEEVNSPENKEYLNKINSSKLKRNSSTIYLQNFLEEYIYHQIKKEIVLLLKIRIIFQQ